MLTPTRHTEVHHQMATLFQLATNQLAVETAAGLLKRLYWAERELFRTTGAKHITVANWEAKTLLPRHLWEDTLHADALRTRVLELRYPRRDVDQDPPQALVGAIHEMVKAQTDAEILAGLYTVFKPAQIAAYERYLAQTDPIDDAPTVYLLRRLLEEKRAQVQEGLALLDALSEPGDTEGWTQYLGDCLVAAGGLLGAGAVSPAPSSPGFSDRPGYQRPLRGTRDPKFLPAIVANPYTEPETPPEIQVWPAIDHVNEIWAAEVPLMVAWELTEMPWDFYRDIGRWAWDECRHTIMGERRLRAWGFEIGVDIPMADDTYQCAATESPQALLALLNEFEQGGPPGKRALKATLEELGDPHYAQDADYDWADEAIHLSYGNRWLKYLIQDEDELDALRKGTMDKWYAYRAWARTQPLGDYEPFMSRIMARMRSLEETG